MNSKQFAWLYLVEHGTAGIEPSYYGGYSIKDARLKNEGLPWGDWKTFNKRYLQEIKIYGVDWDKTKAPISTMVSEFEGTFHDSSEKEYLFGEITLNGGLIQSWCGEAIEVTNVFDMMATISNSKHNFEEIFNE